MSILPIRWKLGTLGIFMLAGVYACVATGVGYDGGVGAGYVGGYYEPYGYDYGGWGGGYLVGPGRHGERGPPASRPYRTAPVGHGSPSIPSRSRGGGDNRR
jgi:hypothetical protein